MIAGSILWRRLDGPGHDACRLERHGPGWQLDGAAVFALEGRPVRLSYLATCDAAWRARNGRVRGWIGDRSIEVSIERTAGGAWAIDGRDVPETRSCEDLDFGFTPATNLLQIRRLALGHGQGGDAPAAWLDVATGSLDVLLQRYERRSETTYWYQAPRFSYAEMLEVDPVGFVRRYPGLWEAEV
jgi:hypothetical protein